MGKKTKILYYIGDTILNQKGSLSWIVFANVMLFYF